MSEGIPERPHTPAASHVFAPLASLDLNLLVALEALLDEVSVTRAAARVGVSQPAMSHSLRRLRTLLDDPLLIRRGRASALTPRARQIAPRLREVLRGAERLVFGAPFDPQTDRRTVTVGLSSSSAQVIGRRLVASLTAAAPRMRLDLRIVRTDVDDMLANDDIDVALQPGVVPSVHPRELLYRDGWVVLTGDGPLAPGDVVDALRTRSHVIYDTGSGAVALDVLRANGIEPDVRVVVNDALVLADLIAGGPHVALHLEQVARALPPSWPLWWTPAPFPPGPSGMHLIWSPWQTDRPFREWFRDLLVSCAPD